MKLIFTFTTFLAVATSFARPVQPSNSTVLEKRVVSSAVYNELVEYFRYASSAYATTCLRPSGNTLVTRISDVLTDTQAFIARDDSKHEIVAVFRGSTSLTDFLTDSRITLTGFTSPGVNSPFGTLVHSGFLSAWNSVASDVISAVRSQLAAHPGYTIATSGHSLGGALSSLAAISLKQNFPSVQVRMFTYGQPRTGNSIFATWVNSQIGADNLYRGVHTIDGVPTIIPVTLGYRHHGVEYWQYIDPSSALTVRKCNDDGEDLTCSTAIISGGINLPHLTYFNIPASTPFCT